MVRFLILALVLVHTACSGAPAPAVPTLAAVPPLDRATAENVAVGADKAARSALADLDPAGLSLAFKGRALEMLRDQVQRMADRGLRLEERNAIRRLESWDAGAREVVIQVEAQDRLISPDERDPRWSNTVRRWWTRLIYIGDAWWVVDQRDLAPDRRRSLITSAQLPR